GIVREFQAIDEFLVEVYKHSEMDEVRLLVEVDETPAHTARAVQERLRAQLGIRVEVVPVPSRSLPRYELKARRVVRRSAGPS
ncbi:MAG: phenylacetate--CoA ligase family protein, partial [Candidatus Rokubacteria bacterium]|nr:phenylacetate--CoA ligase family protein [Candidatus Rokubacteria bacterium]